MKKSTNVRFMNYKEVLSASIMVVKKIVNSRDYKETFSLFSSLGDNNTMKDIDNYLNFFIKLANARIADKYVDSAANLSLAYNKIKYDKIKDVWNIMVGRSMNPELDKVETLLELLYSLIIILDPYNSKERFKATKTKQVPIIEDGWQTHERFRHGDTRTTETVVVEKERIKPRSQEVLEDMNRYSELFI